MPFSTDEEYFQERDHYQKLCSFQSNLKNTLQAVSSLSDRFDQDTAIESICWTPENVVYLARTQNAIEVALQKLTSEMTLSEQEQQDYLTLVDETRPHCPRCYEVTLSTHCKGNDGDCIYEGTACGLGSQHCCRCSQEYAAGLS